LELRHLIALEAVARHLSFNRAAEELGYTSSAISQQIVALERIVGMRVFERTRGPRPITLTEAGRVVLGHAQSVLSRMQAAEADIDALTQGAVGELRVGTYQSIAAQLLPQLLAEFRRGWPRIEVTLFESGSHDQIDDMVERGALDVAFTVAHSTQSEVVAHEDLLADPYVLVLPPDHDLVRQDLPITLAQLGGIDLIGYRVCRAHAQVERHLRSRGIEPRIVFRAEDNALLQRLAGAGLGAAIMPVLAVDPHLTDTVIKDLSHLVPDRRIGLICHRQRFRPPASVAFAQLAATHAASLRDELASSDRSWRRFARSRR
jgi:DNA-binding transcriptional LysR family regulator